MENLEAYIEVNPKVMMGKPVMKGTRITVEVMVEQMAAGRSIENLLTSYPAFNREAILAALQFTANNLRADYMFPLAS